MCCFDPLDVMFWLERAFGIRLNREDSLPKPAEGVRLFRFRTRVGELYELVTEKRKEFPRREPKADLFQTALTDIREALGSVLERAPDSIRAHDRLEELLPRGPRRGLWRRLDRRLGKQELPWLHPAGCWYPIVWWISFLVSSLVPAGLLGTVLFLCGWSIGWALAALTFLWLVWLLLGLTGTVWILSWRSWPIREFPYGIVTVRDLAQVVLGLNRHHYVEVCEGDPDDDVWTSLRVIAAYLTGLELEEVTEQTDLAAPSVSGGPSDERVFRCSGFSRFICTLAVVVFSMATALVVVLSPVVFVVDPPPTPAGCLVLIAILIIGGCFFAGLLVWSVRSLRRAYTTIRVDEHGITRAWPRGRKTSLAWAQVESIVERPLLKLPTYVLELHGFGGQVVLNVDQELEGFGQLVAIIMEKTDWQRLVWPSYRDPHWPVRFHKRLWWLGLGVAIVAGGVVAPSAIVGGSLGLATIFLVVAVLFLLPLLLGSYRLELDARTLTILYPRGRREILKISEIEDVSVRHFDGFLVDLRLAEGRTKVIGQVREGGLALAAAIDAARRQLRAS